jgi:hypothetical protein
MYDPYPTHEDVKSDPLRHAEKYTRTTNMGSPTPTFRTIRKTKRPTRIWQDIEASRNRTPTPSSRRPPRRIIRPQAYHTSHNYANMYTSYTSHRAITTMTVIKTYASFYSVLTRHGFPKNETTYVKTALTIASYVLHHHTVILANRIIPAMPPTRPRTPPCL